MGRQHLERHWWDGTRAWEEAGAVHRHQENSWDLEKATIIQDAQKRGDCLETLGKRIAETYDEDQAESLLQLAETELPSDWPQNPQPPREMNRRRSGGKSPLFKASAFAFRSFPLLICLPSAFAPLGNKRL